MPKLPKRYSMYCKHGLVLGLVVSLSMNLVACSGTMPVQPSQAKLAESEVALTEYRSNQVEVTVVRQQYVWRLPDANQHLAQFTHHIQVDGSVPARLQDFVISYRKPQHLSRSASADNALMTASMVDEVQISRNGQFLVRESIAPAFTGQQSYRRLEAARLKVGDDSYVLTVANGFLHRPMWLAIFAADGSPVYRIGLPHGHWQFTEHADGISMVDTSGSGRRLLIRPALQ
ncbi:hypothetical protein [Undibacterium sp.]|uniref:hypothetical protein n=1 Tax=Undibacterium sp. TaxID=1914977 RepID=UPI002731A08B|nr:hypothetical protein [Undibacterium sp.]MDP1977292.1 hypothetical protein [Undibacterium sp.]